MKAHPAAEDSDIPKPRRFAPTSNSDMSMQLEQHPWEAALGVSSKWPSTLRLAAQLVSSAPQAMILWWGDHLVQLHNRAAAALLGPVATSRSLGEPARDAWRSHWEILSAVLQPALEGRAARTPDVLWTAEDNGSKFERYLSIACTPVLGDGGRVDGVVGHIEETTACVLADRRMRFLSSLARASREAHPWRPIQQLLATATYDLPFLLVYEIMPDEARARLRVASGTSAGSRLAPAFLRMDSDAPWPIARVAEGETLALGASQIPFEIAGGPWPEQIQQLMLVPLRTRGRAEAVAIVGLSTRLAFDDGYRSFIEMVVRQLETAMIETGDVSTIHEASRRLRRLQHEAAAASQAKDEFLALLGHELRNPLAPIVTALDLMRMRDGGENKERVVIERQVEHLRRLVDDLLDVARITRGKLKLDVHRIEIEDVVERAVEMAAPLLEAGRHRLTVSVPPNVQVRGDVIRLAQVVANLLTNAAKYSGEGAAIRLEVVEQGPEVVLSVTDHGMGIPSHLLPRLFEPFVQVRRQERQSAGGLGLGLALVRSLTELHGGHVAAHSDGPGCGSRFTVHLPVLRSPPSASSSTTLARVRSEGPPRLNERVLVVDDNEDAAEMLAVVLRRDGYAVEVAHDGPSALDKARTFRPHIGILDIGLPVMDGYVLARKLREQNAAGDDLMLVAVTGYGRPRDRTQALANGFDDHFVKPVDFDALRKRLGGIRESRGARSDTGASAG